MSCDVQSPCLILRTEMAQRSPAKKSRDQVKGFLCEVSPIKDTKKPYFEAVLQHEAEYSNVVSFRPEDHMRFNSAKSTRSLVTLENVVLQPSAETSRKMEVFYTHSSRMSCVQNPSSDGLQTLKLSELANLNTTAKTVNINAKIIQEVRKGNCAVWDGQYLPKTEYTVADTTGCHRLTVWCEHNVTVGEWYSITNVSVRGFRGKTSLSTTKNTQIISIPSQGTVVAAEVPTETIKCDIIGANIKDLYICPHNHTLKNVTPSNPIVYCLSCNTHYKTTAVNRMISGHLDLKPESGNVVKAWVENEVIMSVLTVELNASRQEIIQSLIALPTMQVTIRENNIIQMEAVPHNTEIKSEAEAELPVKTEPVESADFYSPPDYGLLFSSQNRKRKSDDSI